MFDEVAGWSVQGYLVTGINDLKNNKYTGNSKKKMSPFHHVPKQLMADTCSYHSVRRSLAGLAIAALYVCDTIVKSPMPSRKPKQRKAHWSPLFTLCYKI